MSTKRIRCTCGRVYDPAKHEKCPDCGAENVVSIAAEPAAPPPLPTKEKLETKHARESDEPPQPPVLVNARTLMIVAAAIVAFIIIVFAVSRSGEKTTTVKQDRARAEPSASPSATAYVAPVIPSHGGESIDLAAMIANAAPGATVTVPAGLYRGGLVVTRAVRIVADSKLGGQVFIQSDGKECLSVRARGVGVQNVQFTCSGIGELPAISVTDGADLDMDACKIQSSSALGLLVAGNASIKALGSTITATNGTALRLNQQAKGNFTQCSFSNSKIGLSAAKGAAAELHACAFENNGMSDANGAIIFISGAQSVVNADDCHFTDNRGGIEVNESASLTVTHSSFKGNGIAATRSSTGTAALSIAGQGSTATLRTTALINSTPYGVNVFAGAALTLEEVEISGARSAGIVVGDRGTPPAHAEIKRCHFLRNGTGIGVFGGSSANVEDSECRENQDGIIVLDHDSQLKAVKMAIISNRDYGIYVHGLAQVSVADSDIQNNARGAQSGTKGKSAERASLTLDNCRVGGNRVFGAGACAQSELILARCVFAGTDKTNIYRERGAIVQSDEAPAPSGMAEPTSTPGKTRTQRRSTQPSRSRRSEEDLSRLIQRFLPPPRN